MNKEWGNMKTHGPLNVRCKPGANPKVVRKIREGKIIKVYKFWNEWANIGICQWGRFQLS